MIALANIKPGSTVTLGPVNSYDVKLNSGGVLVLSRDGEEVQVTHSEARRVGLLVHTTEGNGHLVETAY